MGGPPAARAGGAGCLWWSIFLFAIQLPQYLNLMPAHFSWRLAVTAIFFAVAAALSHAEAATTQAAPLVVEGLGKGTVPVNGPCQFHVGDNAAWAAPGFDDSGWEPIATDRPWGEQGHIRYTGYAWYRCHLSLSAAAGISPRFSLLLQRVYNAYEVYWDGALIGRDGKLDPYRVWYYSQPPRIFSLGSAQSGVLAFRVWEAPLFSDDSGEAGGFETAPLIGSPEAIATVRAALDYRWLSRRQFLFAENLLYFLIALLSFLAWLRHREKWLLVWTSAYALAPPLTLLLLGANIRWPYVVSVGVTQPIGALQDVSLWFLLLWLLPLRDHRGLVRLTRILAGVSMVNATLDGILLAIGWGPRWIGRAQVADGASAVIFTLLEAFPLVLVGVAFSRRKRFDSARWTVAILAFLGDMIVVVRNAVKQGRQFTNWSIASKIDAPLFTLGGSAISISVLTNALLVAAIVYAVYSRLREEQRQKDILEREKLELMHAREQMRHHAEHDDLTGLWNHRIIMERLTAEVERSRREGTVLSVILADIDHFKNINDSLGHPIGDVVLKAVSGIFTRHVRPYDWVGRYGGEEFLIILPGTPLEGAQERAEVLRQAIHSAQFLDSETKLHVTSSFGVASGFPSDYESETVMLTVDEALYQAKRNGRNCVVATDVNVPVIKS
jgi:diguanylate cyclase